MASEVEPGADLPGQRDFLESARGSSWSWPEGP